MRKRSLNEIIKEAVANKEIDVEDYGKYIKALENTIQEMNQKRNGQP